MLLTKSEESGVVSGVPWAPAMARVCEASMDHLLP